MTSISSRSWLLLALIATVFLVFGFSVAIALQNKINFTANLTMDGMATAFMAALAVLAATIILPLWIQPQLYRQREINKIILQDVNSLLSLIEDLLLDYELKHQSKTPITKKDRQLMLIKHKKINNTARVINMQIKNSSALNSFENDIYNPLTKSQGDFSENTLPGKRLGDTTYLAAKNSIDPISYKLQGIRYKLF